MEIMADAVDAREVDEQPEWEASIYNYFYFSRQNTAVPVTPRSCTTLSK